LYYNESTSAPAPLEVTPIEGSCLRKALSLAFILCVSAAGICRGQDSAAPAEPSQPVRNEHRLRDSVKRIFSVEAITSTVPAATIQQLHDWPEEWGTHGRGFVKRIGSLYAQFIVGVAIEDSVKALHHEDTHYTRLGSGNFFRRTGHVITGTVLAHRPDGTRTVALSLPANAYGSWAVATLWSPREYRNAESIVAWGSAGMGTYFGLNFLREYWPDIKSVFRGHRAADLRN
jgi:hypothetical protein